MELKSSLLKVAKEQNKTLSEIADIIGVHSSTVYRLSYKRKSSLKLALQIAYILDCHVEDIIDLPQEAKDELEKRLWENEDREDGKKYEKIQ